MSELVSILIPAYNAEKWIRYTIESALSQTWPRKEIIIVNDGSKDNTLAIARRFESKSVKVISQENKGAAAARNKALEYAQGDYIQWLDADDLLAIDKITVQMNVLKKGLTSLTLLVSPHGIFYYRPSKAIFIPNSLWQDLNPVEWMVIKFSENLWMHPAGWLVSRNLTETAGPWDERLSLDDDGEYFCRVIAASEFIKFVSEGKCYYRQSGFNQLSRQRSEKACESLILSLSLSIRHLRSLEDSERTRAACLKLLQSWYYIFFLDNNDGVKKFNELANHLEGNLTPPNIGWKYYIIWKLFGGKVARIVMINLRKSRLLFQINWDRLLYQISEI